MTGLTIWKPWQRIETPWQQVEPPWQQVGLLGNATPSEDNRPREDSTQVGDAPNTVFSRVSAPVNASTGNTSFYNGDACSGDYGISIFNTSLIRHCHTNRRHLMIVVCITNFLHKISWKYTVLCVRYRTKLDTSTHESMLSYYTHVF